MSNTIFENIKMSGIACAVPDNVVDTQYFNKYFDEKEVDKFINTSGIKSRCYADNKQTASDLCYVAAKKLMEHKGYTGEDIDALIMITQTPDYIIPATSYVLHKRLGLKQDCIVYDINLGCSALPTGICMLASMINSGVIQRGLLLLGDVHNHNYDASKISHDVMLTGDACSACIIEKGNSTVTTYIRSDGNGYDAIIIPGPTSGGRFRFDPDNIEIEKYQSYMNGSDVFLFAITKVPRLFKDYFKENNCTSDDFDYFVFHQANQMILDHIEKKLKLPKEKVPRSIERYGNTDGASVFMTIADLCERENVPERIKFITSAFGIGLNWGIATFEIDKSDVLPIIHTNEYFEEGFLEHLELEKANEK